MTLRSIAAADSRQISANLEGRRVPAAAISTHPYSWLRVAATILFVVGSLTACSSSDDGGGDPAPGLVPATAAVVDPATGQAVDPATGLPIATGPAVQPGAGGTAAAPGTGSPPLAPANDGSGVPATQAPSLAGIALLPAEPLALVADAPAPVLPADDSDEQPVPPVAPGEPVQDTPSGSLQAQITTQYVSEDDLEFWSCTSGEGAQFLYTFFAPGALPDTDSVTPLGFEIDAATASIAEGVLIYIWSVSGVDSLLLDAPEVGIQIDWTSIRFASANSLSAQSSTRGALQCGRTSTAGF